MGGLPRSTFYYRAHPGPRYNAYGYQSVNDELRDLGHLINKKKTYRLMDEYKLLLGKVIRCSGKGNWVQYRKSLQPSRWNFVRGYRKNIHEHLLLDATARTLRTTDLPL